MAIPQHADPAAADLARRWRELDHLIHLLYCLEEIDGGLPVDQLRHGLQCAARMEAADAPEEWVLVGLLHDVGKAFNEPNHGAVAAEMLRGYVSEGAYHVLRTHGEFQAALNHEGRVWEVADAYRDEPWYQDACLLAVLDHSSFDPAYPVKPLMDYLPMLSRLYGLPEGLVSD